MLDLELGDAMGHARNFSAGIKHVTFTFTALAGIRAALHGSSTPSVAGAQVGVHPGTPSSLGRPQMQRQRAHPPLPVSA